MDSNTTEGNVKEVAGTVQDAAGKVQDAAVSCWRRRARRRSARRANSAARRSSFTPIRRKSYETRPLIVR